MIRWGILGTGGMAAALAEAIGSVPNGQVAAIGSRSEGTARALAERFGVGRWYGSYDELCADPDLDVVYVATTNDLHRDNVLVALAHGKAVLCEKPFALNSGQAEEMISASRRAGRFLMEAMWMRFQPSFVKLEELVAAGTIGEVRHLQADFGFPADPDPAGRLLSPALGGGSLLDLGVYPLTLAMSLLGEPEEMGAVADLATTGVDRQLAVAARHRGGALSVWSCSLSADTATEATVAGSEGRLRLRAPFHHSATIIHYRRNDLVAEYDNGYEGSGYRFEIEEVHRCLGAGLLESPRMPHQLTAAVMRNLDRLRSLVGVRYPGERPFA